METFVIVLLVLAVIFLMMGITVVRQGHVYTIERFGRFTHAAHPGFNLSFLSSIASAARST